MFQCFSVSVFPHTAVPSSPDNIYLELTREFNRGRNRVVISSGQAVVLHRLAIMSKDGDWILRETKPVLEHVLNVLSQRRASYRFGAPLDVRWLRGGWADPFGRCSGRRTEAAIRRHRERVRRKRRRISRCRP